MSTGYRQLACAAALALTLGGATAGAQSIPPAPAAPGSGGGEGIGVHGYWVIEVRDPDGTVVSHTEFENDLQTEGKVALVKLLHGASVFSFLYVELTGASAPCVWSPAVAPVPSSCFIVPPGDNSIHHANHTVHNTFRNLASVPSPSSGALVLSGVATASHNGVIDTVRTRAAPACGLGWVACDQFAQASTFTAFSLVPGSPRSEVQPIPVATGQVIQVTVRLTFSSPAHP